VTDAVCALFVSQQIFDALQLIIMVCAGIPRFFNLRAAHLKHFRFTVIRSTSPL